MPLRRPLQESPKEVSARWVDLFVDGNGARTFVLAGGLAVHAVSVFIVATILPDIVRDIGGLAYYAWTSMLFVVGSIGGSVVAPSLLARLGSRASYRVALALFVAGSLVCAAAPTMSVLLAGRLLQGVGGGLLPALAYATIRRLFPEPLWSRAISMLSGVWGVAALTGPFIGGLFSQVTTHGAGRSWSMHRSDWFLPSLLNGFCLGVTWRTFRRGFRLCSYWSSLWP